MNSKRNSNIELFKIIAMFLICLSHVYFRFQYAGSMPNSQVLTFSNQVQILFKHAGWIGDWIFLISTCYFVNKSIKMDIRKILYYWLLVSLLLLTFLGIFSLTNYEIDRKTIIECLTLQNLWHYWYIKAFIIFTAYLPLLSLVCKYLKKGLHLALCIVFFVLMIAFTILHAFEIIGSGIRTVYFIPIYVLIDYGRKYGRYLFYKEKDKFNLLYGLLGFVLLIVVNVILVIINSKTLLFSDSEQASYIYSPVYFMMIMPIFLYIVNKPFKSNKVINYIASLSLIFYIGHHNSFVSMVFDPLIENALLNMNGDLRIPIILGFTFIRFVFGIGVSIIFKETVGRLLSYLFSLIKPRKIPIKIKDIVVADIQL